MIDFKNFDAIPTYHSKQTFIAWHCVLATSPHIDTQCSRNLYWGVIYRKTTNSLQTAATTHKSTLDFGGLFLSVTRSLVNFLQIMRQPVSKNGPPSQLKKAPLLARDSEQETDETNYTKWRPNSNKVLCKPYRISYFIVLSCLYCFGPDFCYMILLFLSPSLWLYWLFIDRKIVKVGAEKPISAAKIF